MEAWKNGGMMGLMHELGQVPNDAVVARL
jgi:hypothetical protein